MLGLGITQGATLKRALAQSTSCGSFRHQTRELLEPVVEFPNGDGDAATEANRWAAGSLVPASTQTAEGFEMLEDGRLQFDGVRGYNLGGLLVLHPRETE